MSLRSQFEEANELYNNDANNENANKFLESIMKKHLRIIKKFNVISLEELPKKFQAEFSLYDINHDHYSLPGNQIVIAVGKETNEHVFIEPIKIKNKVILTDNETENLNNVKEILIKYIILNYNNFVSDFNIKLNNIQLQFYKNFKDNDASKDNIKEALGPSMNLSIAVSLLTEIFEINTNFCQANNAIFTGNFESNNDFNIIEVGSVIEKADNIIHEIKWCKTFYCPAKNFDKLKQEDFEKKGYTVKCIKDKSFSDSEIEMQELMDPDKGPQIIINDENNKRTLTIKPVKNLEHLFNIIGISKKNFNDKLKENEVTFVNSSKRNQKIIRNVSFLLIFIMFLYLFVRNFIPNNKAIDASENKLVSSEASIKNSKNIIESNGSKPIKSQNIPDDRELINACTYKNTKKVKLLIDNGVNVNAEEYNGMTALTRKTQLK